jgi:hypothetical protein
MLPGQPTYLQTFLVGTVVGCSSVVTRRGLALALAAAECECSAGEVGAVRQVCMTCLEMGEWMLVQLAVAQEALHLQDTVGCQGQVDHLMFVSFFMAQLDCFPAHCKMLLQQQ